jgi:hypothetical protein
VNAERARLIGTQTGASEVITGHQAIDRSRDAAGWTYK